MDLVCFAFLPNTATAGYLSFGPIKKYYIVCDVSVREQDWRSPRVERRRRERLQCEAGELAGVTRVQQARPLGACLR